ncbi:MAG: hypothetical protein ACRDNF_21660 [Streptosporangiaceae bacterium]
MRGYRFEEAFRRFLLVHDRRRRRDSPDALMHAARALQMSETWRAQAGAWEALGNEIGQRMGTDELAGAGLYGYPPGREFVGRFYVISDREWARIESPCPDGCANQCSLRQKQAYAFEWAADGAASSTNSADAARLFRRAGWAWEKALHYGKPGRGEGIIDPALFPSSRCLRRAARCYAEAAFNAVLTFRPATRSMITERRWCPACVLDKTSESNCQHRQGGPVTPTAEDLPQTDVERLCRCWLKIAAIERRQGSSPAAGHSAREDAAGEGAAQLATIQGLLAGRGMTHAAQQIYRMRKQYLRDCWRRHHRVRRWMSQLMWLLSGNGSSIGRLLVSLALLYLIVVPVSWYAAWRLGAPLPLASGHGPLPAEAVLFSLSSVANVSNGHFMAGGWVSSSVQVAEGLSAYFALGYLLYVAQRSYTT